MSGPTLYLINFKKSGAYPDTWKPNLATGDIVLYHYKTSNTRTDYGYMFHDAEASASLLRCKAMPQVKDLFGDLDKEQLKSVEEAALKPVFYDYHVGHNHKYFLLSISKCYNDLIDDDDEFPNLMNLQLAIEADEQMQGRYVNRDGSISDLSVIPLNGPPPASAAPAPTVTVVNSTTSAIYVRDLIPKIQYEGFVPKVIRETFRERDGSPDVLAKDLVSCFSAYAFIGNNISKLAVKRHDVEASKVLMNMVTTMGVKRVAKTKKCMTLPRLAIAFMPEYLIFRKHFGTQLQRQTESALDVIYQDVAFAGCPEILGMPGYPEFNLEFSSFIYKPKQETALDDKDFIKAHKKWNLIITKGYSRDTGVHARMTAVLPLVDPNGHSMMEYIRGAIMSIH